MGSVPRLLDTNAKSKLFRGCKKILIVGRCVEVEHAEILKRFVEQMGYCPLSACLEAEHANAVGFKLLGILTRGDYEEVAVLTVDGSMHCTQLHWVVEETFRALGGGRPKRRHFVIAEGEVVEVSPVAIKASRYLSKVQKLLVGGEGNAGSC